MAKTKSKGDGPARAKFDPDDVAEFMEALEEETGLADGVGPSDVPEPPAEPARKIPVAFERPMKRRTSAPSPAEALPEFFEPAGGAVPKDMRRLERSSGRRLPWGPLLGTLFVLAAVTVSGLFVFNRTNKFSGQRVKLNIEAADTVASGGELTLGVQFENGESVDLVKAELTIEYPDGFTYTRSSVKSANTFNNVFPVGTIKRGHAGSVDVTGTLVGGVNDARSFTVTLTYRSANFNSDFQTHATTTVRISSSTIQTSIDGPTKLTPGATGTWAITYRNTSDHDLRDAQVEATYPDGFTLTKSDPSPSEGQNIWRVGTLAQDSEGKITLTGSLNGSVGDSAPLVVSVGLRSSDGIIQPQGQTSFLVVLIAEAFRATVAVNGQTDDPVVRPGDSLDYTVRVANQGDGVVTDGRLVVALNGSVADFTNLRNPSQGVRDKTTLTWTKKELPALARIIPGQDVTVSFSLEAKTTVTPATAADKNQTIAAKATATGSDESATTITNESTLTARVATVFQLKAEARYYDDNETALGSGPVPPIVGQTTAYRVTWTVTNTTNDAKNMDVAAVLPDNVFWTGKQINRDAGDVTFDATTRTVHWKLNTVPAGIGFLQPSLKASFEVSTTPTVEQVGSVVVLLNESKGSATDAFTNQAIAVTQPALTTDVPTDPKAAGEGAVKTS